MSSRIIQRAWCLTLASTLALLPVSAESQASEVSLRSGRRPLTRATTEQFIGRVRSSRHGLHGLAVLKRRPSQSDRERLAAGGIFLLARLTATAYLVRASRTAEFGDSGVVAGVRFLSSLDAQARVAPDLWNGRFEKYVDRRTRPHSNFVLNRDSTINVLVRFHVDVSESDAKRVLREHRTARPMGIGLWRVTATHKAIQTLAANDVVRWIDASSPAGGPDMDSVRDALRIHEIQGFDPLLGTATNLTGAGVRVGVYDTGIDATHPDFGGPGGINRVVDRPAAAASHGTYVAGIIAGNGVHSAQMDSWNQPNDGTAYQWRGIAPAAELIDADTVRTVVWPGAATLRSHVTADGMDLSNHSYWLATDGHYSDVNKLHDDLIRGDDAGDGAAITPRLHVHSAGNFGRKPLVGNQRGYFSLGNQLKNALVVGSYYTDVSRITTTSSLGPTHDGRIKPDVVAPGAFVIAPGYCTATDNPLYYASPDPVGAKPCDNLPSGESYPRQNFYYPQSGTSTAAAATTGVLALVLQEFVDYLAVDLDVKPPLPSTLRALIIHSAKDLAAGAAWFETKDGSAGTLPVRAFEGPDFVSGFGLVDPPAAIDVVRRRAVREDVINVTCQPKTFKLFVSEGATTPVKVTLAWDDPASDVPELAADQPRLINDLDLELTDPTGTKHYPWLLDQQVTDLAGTVLPNGAQPCGTEVSVKRKLLPTPTPLFAGVDDTGAELPGSVDDPISAADLTPAGTGKDHLNNVEQVVAPAIPGAWTIQVSGFAIDAGPQRFSLIGVPPAWVFPFRLRDLCKRFVTLCDLRLLAICRRYPPLCKGHDVVVARGDSLVIRFRDLADRKVIELSALCYALDEGRRCARDSTDRRSPEVDIVLGPSAAPVGVELFDAEGKRLGRDLGNARTKRLRVPRDAGPVFLFISPGDGLKPLVDYAVPVAIRRTR